MALVLRRPTIFETLGDEDAFIAFFDRYYNQAFYARIIERRTWIAYLNVKGTSFVRVNKNAFDIAVGYTYSNGHPLSGDSSQTKFEMFPEYYKLSVKTGYAMVVDKQGTDMTTTWYTDQRFNNGKFLHKYSTGDMTLIDGALTLQGVDDDISVEKGNVNIEGNNKDLNVTGNNSGINITNGDIDITTGDINSNNGDINIEGANKRLYISGPGGGIRITGPEGYVIVEKGFIRVVEQTTAGDASQINQTVIGNASTINQSNFGNASVINQLSAGNAFTVNQFASGNAITVNHNKTGYGMTLNHSGSGNLVTLNHSGSGIGLTINHSASGIAALINQNLNYKGVVINQKGREDGLTIIQSASGDSFVVTQSANGEASILTHLRTGNLMTLNHVGSGNLLTMTHTGSGHGLTVNHSASGVAVIVNQNLNYDGVVLNQSGKGEGLTVNQSGSGVALGIFQSSVEPGILCTGNVVLSGNNRKFDNIGNGSIINTFQLSAYSLSADRIFYTGPVINEKVTISTTTIDCSLGNYFEYNTTVNSQNFVFSNVPQNPNTVYRCTLKCTGSVTIDDFPANVKWSRRSFYFKDVWNDVLNSGDLIGDGSSDTHIITFTTWDNGTTWYANDEKYAP